jgi:hypothetical protein
MVVVLVELEVVMVLQEYVGEIGLKNVMERYHQIPIKTKKHPRFCFVQEFYNFYNIKRQNFIKYYETIYDLVASHRVYFIYLFIFITLAIT